MKKAQTEKLPPELCRLVIALCGDYDRREGVIRKGSAAPEVLQNYESLNRGIDRALAEVCEVGIRGDMRRDIAERRGARRTFISCMGEGTFKRRKRASQYCIARELHLL